MGKRSKAQASPQGRQSGLTLTQRTLVAYYVTVALIAAASLWPSGRVWGLNWWAYFPGWVLPLFGIVAVLWPLISKALANRLDRSEDVKDRYWVSAIIAGIVMITLFIVLRTQTHFLGDGYSLVSLLAAKQPLVKNRELGESLVHIWARDLLGGANAVAALKSYQYVSIAAGALFVTIAVFVARQLLSGWKAALVFLLGTFSGGYTLLYFGYVENYSLFVLSIAVFTFTGLFIAGGRISRWWILLPQAAAILLHVFGVSLLPATLYCLVRGSRIQEGWQSWSKGVRLSLAVAFAVIALTVFFYFYRVDLFFRMAVLPLMAHEFTVENYTLFSGAHLLDLANLILVLVPGSLVFLAVLSWRRQGSVRGRTEFHFLLFTFIPALAAVFIFDPKIGMPRDWDLFSFLGVPLSAIIYYYFLERRTPLFGPALLSVALSLLILVPRVVSQNVETVALEHAYDYKDLDQVKSRQFYTVLVNYCRAAGKDSLGAALTSEMHQRFPERSQGDKAHDLILAGRYRQAITLSGQILKRNPFYHGVWANMGTAYLYLGNYDSAIACYQIASALNPGRAELYGNIAAVYIDLGKLDKASKLLDKAIARDSTEPSFVYNRARIAQKRGDREMYLHYLGTAAMMPKGYKSRRLEYLHNLMQAGDVAKAKQVLKLLRSQVSDSLFYDSLFAHYPQLRD